MILKIYTMVHVLISLLGIYSGLVVLLGMIAGKGLDVWTKFFLATTVATSVTGFFFPFRGFTPGLAVGILSLMVLAVTIFARYVRQLKGSWCQAYVMSAVFALYLNVVVLVVQLFQKVPILKTLAPTQSEAPFVIAQATLLIGFVVLGVAAVKRFCSTSHDRKV
jgi:hypothetical protein